MAAMGRQLADASCILRYAAKSREEFKCKNGAGGQVRLKSAREVAGEDAGRSMFTSITVCSVTVEPGDGDDDLAICCEGVPNVSCESRDGPVVFLPQKLLTEGGTIYPGAKFRICGSTKPPMIRLETSNAAGTHSGDITMLVKLGVE